ncbi:MAG: signal peptidase I [Clostridia bacterium]|nr:signal peptidase I [Clostridia bacterium]
MVKNAIERKNLLGMPKDEKFSFFDVFLIALIIILLINVFVQTVWLSPVEVSGTSMEQTLQNGDWLLIDKLADYKRGDIVVFKATKNDNYIKRVIAVEGDELYSVDGIVFIKVKGSDAFVELEEDYAFYDTELLAHQKKPKDIPLTVIEKDKIFVLGDNRWGSKDSRQIGPVSVGAIIGVVPKWAVEKRNSYAWYFNFVKKINLWVNETFGF